jgi:hypothetical protein
LIVGAGRGGRQQFEMNGAVANLQSRDGVGTAAASRTRSVKVGGAFEIAHHQADVIDARIAIVGPVPCANNARGAVKVPEARGQNGGG